MRCQTLLTHCSNVIFIPVSFKATLCLRQFFSSLRFMSLNGYRNKHCKILNSIFYGFDRKFPQLVNFCRTRHLSSSAPSFPKSKVTWDDYEDISELLFEKHRTLNPLSLRFTDLHEMVKEVVRSNYSFDISGECSEGALERIQMSWMELYEQD